MEEGRVFRRDRPGPGRLDPELLWGILGFLTLLLIHFGPSPALFPVPCPFKLLLGIPCPSCGMTRSWLALGRHEWPLAFRMHPALASGYFLMWGYVPYALGAVAGLWPRVGLSLSEGEVRGIRLLVLASLGVLWGFLILDGR